MVMVKKIKRERLDEATECKRVRRELTTSNVEKWNMHREYGGGVRHTTATQKK